MAGAMIRSTSCMTTDTRPDLSDTFHVLEDEEILGLEISPGLSSYQPPTAPTGPREALDEPPIQHCPNKAAAITSGAGQGPCHCEHRNQGHESLGLASIIDKLQPRIAALPTIHHSETKETSRPHPRRPPINWETFQPLDAVQEETTFLTEDTRAEDNPAVSRLALLQEGDFDNHDLLKNTTPIGSNHDQVKKHLAGQFDWLMSYPLPSDSTERYHSHNGHTVGREARNQVYGCNLLLRKGRPAVPVGADCGHHSANSYMLLVRPLKGYANLPPLEMDEPKILADDSFIACIQAPYDPVTPLKVPEIVQAVEHALSPSLTVVSDRSCSFGDASSRTGSFSLSRIEDSLEELDRLEEELEALDEVTRSRRIPARTIVNIPSAGETLKVLKRASVACGSATVRVKSSKKMEPSLRRSSSLTLRDKRQLETKVGGAQPTARPGAKSTKPPTVPKFELPGDAVSRRLKEQREARQAQQAEAAKASAPRVKPRTYKHLPKPSFELPGEAISRRKREEIDAKLRAQEEEERKRREFKARPMKQTTTPSSLPRETIASRARQAKIQEEHAEKKASASKAKRLSIGPGRATPGTPTAVNKTQHPRGRKSTIVSIANASRATSSTGSISGKRSSVSAEVVVQQRLRGKEIYARDNTSFMERKEREKRERECAAKTAREQAAERSRIASREWAEKKRLKEVALKGAMQ